MSRDASVSLPWADGDYTFRLGIGQLREVQEKCDAGPNVIFRRIMDGTWRVDDLVQVIRLGLIGGGAKPGDALKLVQRYVEQRPLAESVSPAALILAAVLHGTADEPLGKSPAATEAGSPLSRTENSASPPSMDQAP